MAKFGQHLDRLRSLGVLWRAQALMSAHDGWGVDGARSASFLRTTPDGALTEMHVNAVKPVITNVLSLICSQRPAVKPVAVNQDSDTAAQTRLALQLHEAYDRKTTSAELEVETVRGGLLASAWWLVQQWAPGDGEEWGVGTDGEVLYQGDVRQFSLPVWAVAADMTASNVDQRRWVVFCRQANRFELATRVKDPVVRERLLNYKPEVTKGLLASETVAAAWDDVQRLDALRGDVLDADDGVVLWEARHLPSPACPEGRLVQWVAADCVLWDSMNVAVVGGQVKTVRYPYDEKELHAYDYAPERKPGTTVGHTGMWDVTGLQQFVDLCTTSMASTVDRQGVSNVWTSEEPQAAKKIGQYGGIRILTGKGAPPTLLDFPALKPEVVEAADWAQGQMAKAGALNAVVMGEPPKGMPASAQALQRAQAVQYHQVSQQGYVRLVSRVANGRLRLLKRFADSKRVTELAGKQGEYERRAWSAKDIAGVERFDVEPVNPMSQTFEGRQAILDQLEPGEVDVMARLDFLQTGSMPKALRANTARDELIDRNVSLLERGVGLPAVVSVGPAGEPIFQEGGEFVRLLKSDPHHLAIPRYLAVMRSSASQTDKRAVAALSVATESFRLWTTCTPDECVAFGLPFLPSHQAAMAPPPPGAPSAEPIPPPGDEGNVDLPSPPDSPLTGEEGSTQDMGLPNA